MKILKRRTIGGIAFVLIAGTLSHFLYEWTGKNFVAGLFTPVNESVWEHMKLVFFPMLLYSFFMIPGLKDEFPCLPSAYCFGMLLGTLLIPVLFYAYNFVTGRDVFFLDLATFAVSVILGCTAVYKLTLHCGAKAFPGCCTFLRRWALSVLWYSATIPRPWQSSPLRPALFPDFPLPIIWGYAILITTPARKSCFGTGRWKGYGIGMHTSESAENYLETILILSKCRPVVRSVDVAEELGYKKSSVSVAMKNLREKIISP